MDLRSYGFFVACLAFAFWALSPFALPLGLGLVAAYTSEAPVDWLSARLQLRTPWGRRLLAPLFVAAVLIAGGLPAWGAVAEAWRELAPLVSSEGALNNFQAWLQRGLGILVARLEGMGLTIPLDAVLGEASGLGRHLAGGLAGTVGQFLRDTPARFLDFVLFIITWGYFAGEGRRHRDPFLRALIPWKAERTLLAQTVGYVLRGVVIANLASGLVQGLLCGVAFALLGIQGALTWGVLAFFLSFVPVLGTAVLMLGALLYCLVTGVPWGIPGLLVTTGLLTVADHFLKPLFMGSSRHPIPFFWMTLSFLGGVAAFGIPGILLGPLAISLTGASMGALGQGRYLDEGGVDV